MSTMDGATLVRRSAKWASRLPIVVHVRRQATERGPEPGPGKAGADAYFDKNDVRRGALAAVLHDLIEAA